MLEPFWAALGDPALPFIATVSLLAGLVYGFAGFGSALIFMPLSAIFLPPAVAVGAFSLSALASLVTVVPSALRVAERKVVAWMLLAAIVATPFGVALLRLMPADTIRLAISCLTLITLTVLILGWKVPAKGGWGLKLGVGAMSGVFGGATGLNGPPVILFNLGTDQPVQITRANLAVFLTLSSLTFLPQLWLQGMLSSRALWLGIILLVPYGIGTQIGSMIFAPKRAWLYRLIAFGLIGFAGLSGLPIWN